MYDRLMARRDEATAQVGPLMDGTEPILNCLECTCIRPLWTPVVDQKVSVHAKGPSVVQQRGQAWRRRGSVARAARAEEGVSCPWNQMKINWAYSVNRLDLVEM